MKINGLFFLRHIIDKLYVKHNVLKEEVEEVFAQNPWIIFVEKGHFPGEDVYAALGQTEAGRYLKVFFVYKADKQALIVSARDMTHTDRRRYERK
ncbi:MAG: BrnT family toxin [Anaerolineales bacterium]|nr:BrnT family toxin [Anaerolineales bacterium]